MSRNGRPDTWVFPKLPEKIKPIIAYVTKLTLSPAKMTQADADAVYGAGWSEQALYDAILVASLFNLMNRIVEGTGCVPKNVDGEPNAMSLDSYVEWGKNKGLKQN